MTRVYRRGKASAKCTNCGKGLLLFACRVRDKNFCSNSCRYEYGRLRLIGKRFGKLVVSHIVGRNSRNRLLYECVCDCGMKRVLSDTNVPKYKGCGCNTKRSGENNPMWKGGQITARCSNPACNKAVQRDANRVLRAKQLFCSPKCRAVVLNQGETHPRWFGGRSFEPYPPTWTFRFREMIRERDGRECLMCGAKENGTRHDVHHQDFDKMNVAPENLVTLCHPCHRKTYGKKYEQGWRKIFRPDELALTA